MPGNHDIPLHNIISRFIFPFRRYEHYIDRNMNPFYINEHIAILGINSVTPFTVMDGFVDKQQLNLMADFFKKIPDDVTKIVCMHHNMIKPEQHKVLINLEETLSVFAHCKISIILSGHLHDAYVEKIHRDYISQNMYVVTAATAISHRLRTQPNSFNVIDILSDAFLLTIYELQNKEYVAKDKVGYAL